MSTAGGFVVYERRRGWVALDLRELWSYRELLYFLTWRDILVRYKQAVLGVAWAVLQPFLTMIVFTVVFNRLLNVESGDSRVPYEVFSFSGLLAWQFFAGALTRSGVSLVGNSNLLTKVYFPRLVIPLSAVLAGLVDFVISFVILLVLMAAYGIAPTWQTVFLPLFVLLAIVSALAVSLWLSALNVLYRDVQYVIPFLVQLWMFVSPVIYPIDEIQAGALRIAFSLNPMTGVIGGFRWALLGQQFPGRYMWISIAMAVALLLGGLFYFRRMERVFADVV
ncbi:MAG: phosphate ABC transporter permease [Actinobacteria bacterium RBG_16_64_13]|nr:MAG: phosphate ABC transporter permease [Actinobacteria bacterium RBG_16_64_13]